MRRSRIVAVSGIPGPGAAGVRIRLTEAAVAALRLLMLTERTHPAHRFAMSAAERLVIEPLGKQHGRSAFCCGIAELDRYLKRQGVRLQAPWSRNGDRLLYAERAVDRVELVTRSASCWATGGSKARCATRTWRARRCAKRPSVSRTASRKTSCSTATAGITLRAARAGPRDRTGRRTVAFEPGNANCRCTRFAHAPRPHPMGVCNAMAYNVTVPKQADR